MKKKLIFITEALWIGGIETALVNLLNRLDRERYDVTCLILRDERETASRITAECRLLVADRHHTVSFEKPYRYARMYDLMEEPQHASRVRRLVWRALRLALRAPEARRYSAYIKDQLGGEHFDTAIIYSDRAAEYAVRAVNADRFLMFYHHGAMRREYHDTFGYRRAEKIIAVSEALAEKLGAPCVRLISRKSGSSEQKNLSADERDANVKKLFSLSKEGAAASLDGMTVLMVDDLVTTGATAAACVGLLRAAGAEVFCAALAYTAKRG